MKKVTTTLLLLSTILSGCGSVVVKSNHLLIISEVKREPVTTSCPEKYVITFENNDLLYRTDTLYSVGDTLQLEKFKK